MGRSGRPREIKSFPELIRFYRARRFRNDSISFKKCISSLFRKWNPLIVIIETDPQCAEFAAECKCYRKKVRGCKRIHFYGKSQKPRTAQKKTGKYLGYCDLRPDGTVAKGFITEQSVSRNDTYTCLVCKMAEKVSVPGIGEEIVTGFPHAEKDGGIVMCAQATIGGVMDYWAYKQPKRFRSRTGPEITHAAGVDITKIAIGKPRGLDLIEIERFFKKQGFHCHYQQFGNLTLDAVRERNPSLTIYGYLESGLPVIAMVKTHSELHALTIIGHTFDKHAWPALADTSYFRKPLSGYGHYHSNLTWIKQFIVQDDNLGPYYFLPRDIIPEIIAGLFVPIPYPSVRAAPAMAESAGYVLLREGLENGLITKLMDNQRMIASNRQWLQELVSHERSENGDGWVLRPVLRSGSDLVASYEGHEFYKHLTQEFGGASSSRLFWKIEVSWPDLYCFHSACAATIIVDSSVERDAEVMMIHLPGVLMTYRTGARGRRSVSSHFASKQDAPRPHEKPAKINLPETVAAITGNAPE